MLLVCFVTYNTALLLLFVMAFWRPLAVPAIPALGQVGGDGRYRHGHVADRGAFRGRGGARRKDRRDVRQVRVHVHV